MPSFETELQDLREKNNELVQKVQYWKMTANQKENEKLELMKENNDLRLKLSRLRSGGAAHARKLEAEIQSASKQALSHLVEASSAVTRTVQLAKTYMQDRQELEAELPRWSNISNTPNTEKVHRVLPMLIGGQSIHPVVSLSRTINLSDIRSNRSPSNTENHSFPERALPMHLLQDLYIPLTRIDANGLPLNSMDVDTDADDADVNNSAENLGLDDSDEQSLHDSPNVSDSEQFNDTPRLDVVTEELEPPEERQSAANRPRTENPLEGPSWMLDKLNKNVKSQRRVNLEPDSTTECDVPQGSPQAGPSSPSTSKHHTNVECDRPPREFSPTMRRRKRTSSPPAPHTPHYSPRPSAKKNSNNGRILKVLVSKLRLDDDDVSPAKRPALVVSPSTAGPSPSGPGHSVSRPGHSPTKGHATDSSRDNSPKTSPTRRRARNASQRRQSRDRSPVRRQSRDISPTRRQYRNKSPTMRLSRDLMSFDAPSPNGATTSHVIVSESGGSGEPAVACKIGRREKRTSRDVRHEQRTSRDVRHEERTSRDVVWHEGRTSRDITHEERTSRDIRHEERTHRDVTHGERTSRDAKHDSQGSINIIGHESDSGSSSDLATEGRTRRARKTVVYKEKPLNRKMRR